MDGPAVAIQEDIDKVAHKLASQKDDWLHWGSDGIVAVAIMDLAKVLLLAIRVYNFYQSKSTYYKPQ